MFLHNLHLYNFKSYNSANFSFTKGINCFVGNNGVGKTNVLDAIYYTCLTKSYFNSVDQQLIRHEQVSFKIESRFKLTNEQLQVKILLPKAQKKEVSVNDIKYDKISLHIGLLPVVMVAPDDNVLIYGGSEERRRFIDTTLSQVDRKYLEALQEYNKYLLQRNALLKQFAEQQYFDTNLLLAYDTKLAPLNTYIFNTRRKFIEILTPVFNNIYKQLSNENEKVSLAYESSLAEKEAVLMLKENIERDRIMKRTMEGIHRDDLVFNMNDEPIKKFGSQGQQKTFLLSLKLAQAFYLENELNKSPLLLLDDIFDKLDLTRSGNLLAYLHAHYKGQIFITDTQRARIEKHFGNEVDKVEIFEINNVLT